MAFTGVGTIDEFKHSQLKFTLNKYLINFQPYFSSFGLHVSNGYDDSEYTMDFHSTMSSLDAKRIEDDTYCNPNASYVWCLPRDYNREKHPFTCEFPHSLAAY